MAPRPLRIWVTRTQPGADATAARLLALGHEPLIAPLLEVRALASAEPDLEGVSALAFTSTNGLAAFCALSSNRHLPVFAVGDATADQARAAGFAAVRSAHGDVGALGALIAAEVPPGALVLHPCAREPAGDLAQPLAAAGVQLRAARVYESVAVEALPPVAARALADGALDAVLIHSPKAARTLTSLLTPAAAAHLEAFALSPACAKVLADCNLRALAVAEAPREDALLALLPAGAAVTPRPLLGAAFWIGLAGGLACILAGMAVAIWGPRLFPPPAKPHPGRPAWQSPPAQLNRPIPDPGRPPAQPGPP